MHWGPANGVQYDLTAGIIGMQFLTAEDTTEKLKFGEIVAENLGAKWRMAFIDFVQSCGTFVNSMTVLTKSRSSQRVANCWSAKSACICSKASALEN